MVTGNSGNALLSGAQARLPQMITLIRQLVEQESPSFNKQAVDALGSTLAREFERRGAKVTVHRTAKFGDHLQADFAGSGGKPIMLLGHFDTVYDLGTTASMPWREERGRICGPGVLDMKTGIAQALCAIDLLRDNGELARPVRVLLVTDEEVGSESSRSVTERLARESAAVLVCEPAFGPKGALKTGRKGVGDYTVRVHGVAAHAGLEPEKGQSAIVELARQVTKITAFTDMKRGLTVNPGVIRGGTRTNVVAEHAECEVDVRIAKLADAARIEKKFRSLKPFNRRCKLEVSGGVNRPPMERGKATVHLFELAQKAASEFGAKLKEITVGGGSDGNFTAAIGISTLDGLGAVGDGAHARHEYVVTSEIPRRTALLARLIELA